MPKEPSWVEKNPGACGGDASIRKSRHAAKLFLNEFVRYQLA